MFDVFGNVKGLIKLDSICIDNNVFRLHYKATFVILIVCSLLVTSKYINKKYLSITNLFIGISNILFCRQYIGDPIDCIVEEIPEAVCLD